MPKRSLPRLVAAITLSLVASVYHVASAQKLTNSIVATDFDFIVADDPSSFKKIEFVGKRRAEMPDKRGGRELFQSAFQFRADFSDGTSVNLYINSRNQSREAAEVEAMRFVGPLGKLPTALRSGVRRVCVHQGGKSTTAFSDIGLIVMYSENAGVRIANHDLEETVFHESVHAAWDKRYGNSKEWHRAQMRDAGFVTLYAKSNPKREDLAETTLFAYTLTHHPERLPTEVRRDLQQNIPHRIAFVSQLIPAGKPIHFRIEPSQD